MIDYTALLVNLFSMTRVSAVRLRQLSALANSIYILYGILIQAYPVIIGCCIDVILHSYQLIQIKKNA